MKLRHAAFIFLGPELDPEMHRSDIKTPQFTLTSIGVAADNWAQIIKTAKALVVEGVQAIELCAGFGPAGIAKIAEALNHKIPVGGVFYGAESCKSFLDLLKD